jgi:hypothetical protein
MKNQIKFLWLRFYGPWATPCQESTPTPSILLVFSLLEVLRFGLRKYHCILKLPGFWTALSNWMMFFIQDKEKKVDVKLRSHSTLLKI